MLNEPPNPIVLDEARLAALAGTGLLDTASEQGFDNAVRLATRLCAAPVALVSLVAADRQWFKANIGFPHCETDLDRSVCKFALAEPDLLVVPDLTADPRTADNPLVTDDPHIRFYAGAPLRTRDGQVLGSLCVIDTAPRPGGLTPDQADDLRALGQQVSDLIELRRAAAAERASQAEAVADAARLEAMIAAQQVVTSAVADLDTIFRAVVDGALSVIHTATGAVIELREGDDLVYRTAAGTSAVHKGIRLPLGSTLSGRALLEEAPLHCPDTLTDPQADHALARDLGIRSMVVVPVFRQGVAIGLLKVQSSEPGAFTARDILMTQVLAGLVASGFGEVAEAQTRRALRDAESRYKAIFDSATDFAIVAADAEARITDWNAGAEHIMGWRAGDVRGQPLDVFFTPEDRAAGVPQDEERTANLAGSAEDERWHQRSDGGRFWATGRMMTLRHEDDGVRGYLKILQDRTRERRRELRLALVARASQALLATDAPTDAILPVLLDGAEALGFDQSFTWELAPDRHLQLTHSVGVDEAAKAALARVSFDVPLCGIVAASGRPLVLSGLQAGDEPRYTIARDAGIDAYASYPITSRGAVAGVISFATCDEPAFDPEALAFFATMAQFLSLARERLDADRSLRESDARSRRAQEAGQVGTFEMDVASGMMNVSPELARVFGVPPVGLYSAERFEVLVLPEDRIRASSETTRQAGTAAGNVEYRIRRADDGEVRWIARTARFELSDEGKPVRMFGTVRDITDRRMAEEALRASEARWRGLFENMEEGYFIGELVRDAAGEAVDFRFVEVNPAFPRQTGLPTDTAGHTMRELVPEIPLWLVDTYARTIATGIPETFEIEVPELGRIFEVRARPDAGDRFAVLFLDATASRRQSIRQAALVELGDRLRELDDVPRQVQTAAEIMARITGATRAGYGVVDTTRETVEVLTDWCAPGQTSVAGLHAFRTYGSYIEDLKRGEVVAIEEVTRDPRTRDGADALLGIGVRSLLNVPIVERGRLVGIAFVHYAVRRAFADDELTFVRTVADRVQNAVARVRAEERQDVLNHELSHRLKNTLAIVQSIASQTLRVVPDRAPIEVFEQRIVALSRAHDLLLQDAWAAAPFRVVAESVLAPHAPPDRFDFAGPEIGLSPQAALSLSLLLHELATNAVKYGSLSVPGGRVRLTWTVTDGVEPMLEVCWREVGGPPAREPERRGFGSRLIRMGLMGTRDVDLTYANVGLSAAFRAPLAQAQAS